MTQSMLELKVPAPIRTFGAYITIEGELPAFSGGSIFPTWSHSGELYWGGDNEVVAAAWDSGHTYSFGDAVSYGGYVYRAGFPVPSAGTAPVPGTESGGFIGDPIYGGGNATCGVQQSVAMSAEVTVQGLTIYGIGSGINSGTKIGIVLPGSPAGSGGYNTWTFMAEGTYTGPDGASGEVHIPLDKPALLLGAHAYIIVVGDTQPLANGVFLPFDAGHATTTSPVSVMGDNFSASTRDGAMSGSNSSRLYLRFWTSPWAYLPSAVRGVSRDARFLVYVGSSGQSFDDITDDMMTEVATIDTTYVGPSAFGGTGPPGTTRHCFRLKDIVPANAATLQSVYVKYVPSELPADHPHGVAVYNVTVEPYTPGYELGAHTTTALFRPI